MTRTLVTELRSRGLDALADAVRTEVITAFGFRTCYRRPTVQHHPDNLRCACLRTEIPVGARALSFGALGTPDRNHTCPACRGDGAVGCDGLGLLCCPRCAGAGEVRADRSPAGVPTDAGLRGMVSAARKAGRLGVK